MQQPTFKEFLQAWATYQDFIRENANGKTPQKKPAKKKKRRQDAMKAGRPWSAEEKRSVVADFEGGMTMLGLARKYGRTQKAIHDRLFHVQYGLMRPQTVTHWQDDLVS
jgi:hypothetical protein